MSELKVNIHLDEQTASDLKYLQEELGNVSVAEVLQFSVKYVAKERREQSKCGKRFWKESGLLGCIENAPEDLSVNYKKYVAEYLYEKHSQHVVEE